MERKKICQGKAVSRQDIFRIFCYAAGFFAIGAAVDIQVAFARDAYPSEKITMVIPYKSGGGYDIYLRAMTPYLAKYLKVVSPSAKVTDIQLRNEYAAAGHKAYAMLFNAKPDGYTIGAIGSGALMDSIGEKSDFDFSKLAYLQLANATLKMIVAPKNGFNNWSEVVSAMKKGPVKMACGSFGRTNHTAAIITNEKMGTNFRLINFPGSAEGQNALVRGDVQVAMIDEEPVLGLLEAKEVKVLLTFSEAPVYPGAVTIKDLGYEELAGKFTDLRFVVGPPALELEPKNILLEALKKTQADPEFNAWAKKFKFRLLHSYGNDAQNTLTNFIKFYEDLAPLLRKYRQ